MERQYKRLLVPRHWERNQEGWYVPYTPENIEKHYPIEEYTRHERGLISASISSNVDEIFNGYYTYAEWAVIENKKQQYREEQERMNSWKYKFYDVPTLCISGVLDRFKAAYHAFKDPYED